MKKINKKIKVKLNLKLKLILLVSLFSFKSLFSDANLNNKSLNKDLIVTGFINYIDGLGRLAIGCIDLLKNDLKLDFISTSGNCYLPNLKANLQQKSNVCMFFSPIWHKNQQTLQFLPNSEIKIAYSMLESTAIPDQWVSIINQYFDAIAVPDKFLVDVYNKSGVKKPIFTLPHGIHLEDFLKQPIRTKANPTFTFGSSGIFENRKNHESLIYAFARKFGNNPNFLLKIHGRFGESIYNIYNLVNKLKLNNVKIINKKLDHLEYINFLKSLDCYVLLTKGEGFSVSPREALALGVPCILTDNTAQSTICGTGYVKTVKSDYLEPAYYSIFDGYSGFFFNCDMYKAAQALEDVYKNYQFYLEQAHKGREWVKQYLYPELKPYYLALIKPNKVVLGDKNKLKQNTLITDSQNLYNKYLKITDQ